ncbi:cornifelin homolog [Microcaecilia unicolor]|uniref:Cornifelin homolog n=1 Tax=Microcaecilia unicolor TaxID=1415580 RepID=A0A6P7WIW9_9AMPH|nr:cornifelin homolog [Microcaecilia unicolor]XP_030043252.1 cornifelin homolog [Microcaecilia unicolor]XP_030043253.1 cornifelin homolog [Microcaecilia unicolor]XP_030043254.1 cornifelin homolog [Microcaecilia unicolor]XP_030043255.1 cornifelin homolog [Microcaecilia unicolor]XP_030043256.1 cornifelin homolog [Microcaecilia unicolor]XP_030043451.1 cornifelin homolog [Microcaecilia unicolor]XP_030043452.1 cornifelin homolog [Microcaecilia unicolor]XP_030043453.1 cornifelin homolog [Microcae
MTAINVQPMPVTTQAVTVLQKTDWSTGVCDCCDDLGICCFGFWCLPCFMCKTADDFGECLCLPLLEILAGYGVPCPPISMAMRSGVRERYGIQGSICNDCCILCWCYNCAWCQMSREIKKRKQPITIVNAQAITIPHAQLHT